MNSVLAIMWFIGLIISILFVFEVVGSRTMVQFFPEGWRWWKLPLRLLSLAVFAAVVHFNPF